jgi:hypothetical protein
VRRTFVWRGLDAVRLELAEAEVDSDRFTARGTQIGVEPGAYELRYELGSDSLSVQIVGVREVEVELDGYDFFDLGYSPLFNSLPILGHALHEGRGEARDFVMAWVSVPELELTRSEQRYELLEPGRVRYSAGSFSAELELDPDGFVIRYPGLAERVYPQESSPQATMRR